MPPMNDIALRWIALIPLALLDLVMFLAWK